MLVLLSFVLLMVASYAAPLSSCDSQAPCMEIAIIDHTSTDSNGKKQYDLCLYWDKTLAGCDKDDEISHACPVIGDDSSKIEGWASGETLCHTVSCGESATWGVKDGSTCKDSSSRIDYGNDIQMKCFDGGSCGGKNSKACQWMLYAPACDSTTTSTTTTSTTTTSLAPDETAAPPETTVADTVETTPAAECACDSESDLEMCLWDNECALSDADTDIAQCVCHDCDCELINNNRGGGNEAVSYQCESCMDCNYNDVDKSCDDFEDGANMYVRDKDVIYYSKDELSFANDAAENKGGLGYIMLPIESVIIVGAVLVALLLIGVCVCCVCKRRRSKGNAEIVPDEENLDDMETGTQF